MRDLILSIVYCILGLAAVIALVVWNRNDTIRLREQEKQEWLKEAREACPCQ
jgi:uncharacterized membrane protein YuzA (DUF378 family)